MWISGDAEGDGGVQIGFGGADGLSAERVTNLNANRAQRLLVRDLQEDGDLDLIVASSRRRGSYITSSQVYVNDGSGTFTGTELPTVGAVDAVVSDLDGDGWQDVVFCNQRGNGAAGWDTVSSIYRSGIGGADYAASRVTVFPTVGCMDVEVGDWDGDGLPDLFVAQVRGPVGGPATESFVLLNDGARFATQERVSLSVRTAASVAVGDIDDDGRDDAVFGWDGRVEEEWEGQVSVFLAADEGGTPSQQVDAVDARNPGLGDLDGDGLLDLLIPNFGEDYGQEQFEPTLYGLNSDGGRDVFDPFASLPTRGTWRAVALDADGDGETDVMTCNAGDGDEGGAETILYYRRDGAYPPGSAWRARIGKVRTPPVIVGSWPEE